MSNMNKQEANTKGKIAVILAGTMLAITGGTLPALAIVSNTIAPMTSQSGFQFQIAQTAAGYCVVSVQQGSSLNIREQPSTNSKVIGSLKNGTNVALGVTDGSEGKNWTRIISPVEGYVATANLKNCRTRG